LSLSFESPWREEEMINMKYSNKVVAAIFANNWLKPLQIIDLKLQIIGLKLEEHVGDW
jgi:hypothetical protein